jgi:hypothetical protein
MLLASYYVLMLMASTNMLYQCAILACPADTIAASEHPPWHGQFVHAEHQGAAHLPAASATPTATNAVVVLFSGEKRRGWFAKASTLSTKAELTPDCCRQHRNV